MIPLTTRRSGPGRKPGRLNDRSAAKLIVAAAFALWLPTASAAENLKIEGLDVVTRHGIRRFAVEIADTPATQEQGLMYRKKLGAGRGMLFDFHTPQSVSFWMRNTLIPLDIIFIDADGRIVSVARNAKPMSDDLIPSGGPVLGVLELRGGRFAEIGAQVGDQVRERIFVH